MKTMKDCSVVTATYELGDGMKGTIGIIGPKRMDYENVLKSMKRLQSELDQMFHKREKNREGGIDPWKIKKRKSQEDMVKEAVEEAKKSKQKLIREDEARRSQEQKKFPEEAEKPGDRGYRQKKKLQKKFFGKKDKKTKRTRRSKN